MMYKIIDTCFGSMRLYMSAAKKDRTCVDFVGEGRMSDAYLTGNYIRLESDGLEFNTFHNNKVNMKIIGVDVI